MALLTYLVTGATYYLGLTLTLFVLSIMIPQAGFVARCLAFYACLMFCAAYGVLVSALLRLVGYGGVSQWAVARAFKWTMRCTTGVRFDIVEGREYLSTRPAVLVGNHQTELDVLFLGAIVPPYCSVTAKKSLRRIPLLGWFMWLSDTVFIDRANRETALRAFDSAARTMREKRQSVFIFPEGTRSYSSEPGLLPFKKGAFHLAVQAGVDIVPIVAENYSHVLSLKKLRFGAGTVRVKVLPPISTKGLTPADVDGLTQRTRQAMLEAIMDLHGSLEAYRAGKAPAKPSQATSARTTATEI